MRKLRKYKTERCICDMSAYINHRVCDECPDHGMNSKWQRELRVLFGIHTDMNIHLGSHHLPGFAHHYNQKI